MRPQFLVPPRFALRPAVAAASVAIIGCGRVGYVEVEEDPNGPTTVVAATTGAPVQGA